MDPRWDKFADVCSREFEHCDFQDQLIAECQGDVDIAWAVYFHLREDSLDWLRRQVPALDRETPITLLASGKADEVRHCLWSMPC
jgi:hypothetical protein